jgi:hypothetical protein
LGVEYQFTSDKDEFLRYQGPKINYSEKAFSKEIYFKSTELLFEKEIETTDVIVTEHEGIPGLFPVYDEKSSIPFDPFASVFYMLSRYEEYLPYRKDEHGRFHAHESLAYKHKFLRKPVVNIWAYLIRRILKKRYPELQFRRRSFSFIPTYDIDIALSYLGKGLLRNIAGYGKDLKDLAFKRIVERTRVLLTGKRDPYDAYAYLINLHKRYQLKPYFFILFGRYGRFDKNLATSNRKFTNLVKHLADYGEIGIHPSYYSNQKPQQLKEEIQKLSKVINKEITASRQHYLKLELPFTYQNLIKNEITDDFTMGFASEIGFRAGICEPYYFYDLDTEHETPLRIHPFAVMEGTLKDYMKIKPHEAMQFVKPLIDNVKAVDGQFITLWHNQSLNDQISEGHWREPYEEIIRYALNIDNNQND